MNQQKKVIVAVLGLVVGLSGCFSAVAENSGDSFALTSPRSAPRLGEEAAFSIPVRVSRVLFESPLVGSVAIRSADEQGARESSAAAEWIENAPEEPAPTGDYLADFRDFKGCVAYGDPRGLQLCFLVSPDVSSVDVSAEKMSLAGLSALSGQRADGCSSRIERAAFSEARKNQDGFAVYFTALEVTENCRTAGERPVILEFQVRKA